MIVQKTPSSEYILAKAKPFKRKFNGRFKKNNIGFQKHQKNAVKCFKCGKPGQVQWNCRSKFNNNYSNKRRNNNRKENQQNNRDIVCIVSKSLFANQDLSGCWVEFGATYHRSIKLV